MAGIDVRHLGEFIREQRDLNNISLRQLSRLAGVSNPYLSQIERGLRKPSAEILQQIAKALRISAEALYVQAGILEHREGTGAVADAVLADEGLTERQKQVLLEIYDSFRKENAGTTAAERDAVTVSLVTASQDLPDDLSTTAPVEPTSTAPVEPTSTAPAEPVAPAAASPAPPRRRGTRPRSAPRPPAPHDEATG